MDTVYSSYGAQRAMVEREGSAGEKQVARMLDRYRIRYDYVHPMAVVDRGKVRLWYTDFWLPDYALAIEYCGVQSESYFLRAHSQAHRMQGGALLFPSCVMSVRTRTMPAPCPPSVGSPLSKWHRQ